MNIATRKKIEATGARVTTVGEFLKLSPEEEFLIDFKIDLGEEIKHRQ